MRITNAITQLESIYVNGVFSMENWITYIDSLFPNSSSMFQVDIKGYDFISTCQPILQIVPLNKDRITKISQLFDTITQDLESKTMEYFNESMDVEIVLYLGLCNGAGWVTDINGQTKVLLGIEKIVELKWDNEDKMNGLILHELGHVFHKQHSTLERTFDNLSDQFLWQLFCEGVAMHFEQILVGDFSYFHQDDGEWRKFYDTHFDQLKKDFALDLDSMNDQNQRYFGDWVFYDKHFDAGYYLGAKLILFICEFIEFDKVISFGIEEVKSFFHSFVENEIVVF